MENLKIGLIIADTEEYKPFFEYSNAIGGSIANFYSRSGVKFNINNGNKVVTVHAVCCGIGKTNAAAAAMFLAEQKNDILISIGFSGGIDGVKKGDIVLGTKFLEHDFDLTGIGYGFAEKPGQEYIYSADEDLLLKFKDTLNCKEGTMVCGDKFVSDEALRDLLKSRFNAVCCDMETAASAYIASLTNLKFAAIRCVSDNAGADAYDDYSQMNFNAATVLIDSFLKCVEVL